MSDMSDDFREHCPVMHFYYVFQREWELLTFLGCFIVLKNRKQGESMWSSLTQAVIYSLCSRGALGQVSYGVCSSGFRTLILFYGKPDSENIPCFREISKSWAPKVVQTQKTYPIFSVQSRTDKEGVIFDPLFTDLGVIS